MYTNPVGVLPARSLIIAIYEILLQKSICGMITTLLTASRVFNSSHLRKHTAKTKVLRAQSRQDKKLQES